MAKKFRRSANFTILFVCEGATEKAFLQHLKFLYVERHCGTSLKIKNAFGKGPENLVEVTIRENRNASYDRTIVFLDEDIPWTDGLKIRQNKRKYS